MPVFQIHCAEIWGGVSVREADIETPGLRAAIHSSASGDSRGGDLYYCSVCAYDTLTRIAIADVRGHGEAVSHLSQWLYEALEARMNDSDGATVLTDLNDLIRRERGFEAITTAVVATLHRDKGLLYYAYAGHPPLLLHAGTSWTPLDAAASSGLPLGIMSGVRYQQAQVAIRPGDRLFLYSDGVSECPAAQPLSEELYGDTQLLSTLQRTRELPLSDARHAIRDDLEGFAGASLVHDDCTFLLLETRPSPPFWKRRILPGKPSPSR